MKTTDKEFNNIRKDILLKFDSDEFLDLKSLDVGYYGLTSYLDKIDFSKDSRICDFYYRYKNIQNEIKHISTNAKKYYFMPIQYEALKFIECNDKSIIMAPTSFGKTLILKEHIYLNKYKTIVYIVPTNALAYELQKSFKENETFKNYLLFDKIGKNKEEEQKDGLLFVGTQEKFLDVRQHIKSIDFAVIDEAYKLADPIDNARCYKLSKSFLELLSNYNCKMCLLTPNAELRGFQEFGFKCFETTFNAVDKHFSVVDETSFYSVLDQKRTSGKTILFCKTPGDVSDISDKIVGTTTNESQFYKQIVGDFHKDWSVAKLLSKGILTHDGIMPKYLQNKMLFLFNKENSNYNMLVGTNSISEGINTPTKYLFLHPSCNEHDNLLLIKNTIGRAGRLGKYPIGHIYSTVNFEEKVGGDVVLEVSAISENGLSELSDTNNDEKIERFCKLHKITKDVYFKIINKFHVSQYRLGVILNVFSQKEYVSDSFTNIAWISFNALKTSYNKKREYRFDEAKLDAQLMRALLQQYYCKDIIIVEGKKEYINPVFLNNYEQRIKFFRVLQNRHNSSVNYSNSEIIDGFIKLKYSTFDYIYYPIALIGKEINDSIPNWRFGEKVLDIIKNFLRKYHKFSYGTDDYDSFDEFEKSILSSIKELGLSITSTTFNKEIIYEIGSKLSKRYSMYDIVNAIFNLSKDSQNKEFYKEILNKYLDYTLESLK